jgi:hypothetical protein
MGSHYESNLMTHFVADAAALGWDLGQLVCVVCVTSCVCDLGQLSEQ